LSIPIFTFTSPQGQQYTVTGPGGATPEQAFGVSQQHLGSFPSIGPGRTPEQAYAS
jgi:hypothetical protein